MINVMSAEFKVKPDKENIFIWFICDVCNLEWRQAGKEYTYTFNGLVDDYLTTFGVDKPEVVELDITDYTVLEEQIVEVGFTTFLEKLLDSSLVYYELDVEVNYIFRTQMIKAVNGWELDVRKLDT